MTRYFIEFSVTNFISFQVSCTIKWVFADLSKIPIYTHACQCIAKYVRNRSDIHIENNIWYIFKILNNMTIINVCQNLWFFMESLKKKKYYSLKTWVYHTILSNYIYLPFKPIHLVMYDFHLCMDLPITVLISIYVFNL